MFLKSPPWNPLLADLITTTFFLLKFSFSPRVRAVHRSQFQVTSTLWSKASNLHYSLVRLPPPPPPPSPAKHTQLSSAGLRHNRGGCRAGPGRPSVTDPARHPPQRLGGWKSGSPRMPGWAHSAFYDIPELRVSVVMTQSMAGVCFSATTTRRPVLP